MEFGFGDSGRTNSRGDKFHQRAYTDASNAAAINHLQIEALESLGEQSDRRAATNTKGKLTTNDGHITIQSTTPKHQTDKISLSHEDRTWKLRQLPFFEFATTFDTVASKAGMVREGGLVVNLRFNMLDQLIDPGTGRLSLKYLDKNGKPYRSLEPAKVDAVRDSRYRIVRDPDGDPRRLAKSTDGYNCKAPYAGRSECTYILRDPKIARALGVNGDSVSLHSTIDEQKVRGGSELLAKLLDIETEVRDVQSGEKLALIEQSVTLSPSGEVTFLETSARRSRP